MNFKEVFSVQNLYDFAVICGTIIFTMYISFRTFKIKLDEAMKNNKSLVSKRVTKQSNLDCEIITEAEKLKELIDADRVQVYEFHNGVHYANGRSALKTSCTYEVCRYGISSCMNMLTNIPLSVIPNFLKALLDKGEFFVSNLEDLQSTMPATYNLKHDMNIKSFYDVIIYNKNNEPIGFVAVQYCNKMHERINKMAVRRFALFVELKLREMK